MFVAIAGTPSAGKHTILEYLLTQHGFTRLYLAQDRDAAALVSGRAQAQVSAQSRGFTPGSVAARAAAEEAAIAHAMEHMSVTQTPQSLVFANANDLLEHVTTNWRERFVTTSLCTVDDIDPFLKRPFFLLVAVDGPLRTRFERERRRRSLTLDAFIDEHDALMNGTGDPSLSPSPSPSPSPPVSTSPSSSSNLDVPKPPARLPTPSPRPTDLGRVLDLAHVTVFNRYPSIPQLYAHLDQLDLLDHQRLRPEWDTYFMTLASLASRRSNCMKRRVGAILVRSKRILSTGYNGTARDAVNCNEGGCPRCNGPAKGGQGLDVCLCLHAEENALLEAGRDRIGPDTVLYCNTCPCLLCSVKIVQCGVREVVYNQTYSMDDASATVLAQGGVLLRQLRMPEISG